MENNYHDIDQLFKQASSNEKGGFQPHFFEEMNAILIADAKSKKRKRILFYFLNGFLILIGLSMATYFINSTKENITTENSLSQNSSSENTLQNTKILASQNIEMNTKVYVEKTSTNNTNHNYKNTSTIILNINENKTRLSVKSEDDLIKKQHSNAREKMTNSSSNNSPENRIIENKITSSWSDNQSENIHFDKNILLERFIPKRIPQTYSSSSALPYFEIPEEDLDSIKRRLPSTSILGGIHSYQTLSNGYRLSPLVGLQYHQPITNRFGVDFSLIGYQLNSILQDSYSAFQYYDIGYNIKNTRIEYGKMTILEIPMNLTFDASKKWRFHAGVHYSKVIQMKSTHHSDITSYRRFITRANLEPEEKNMPSNFNSNIIGYQFGAGYQFSKNWSSKLELNFNESFFNHTIEKTQIIGGRLIMTYKLF